MYEIIFLFFRLFFLLQFISFNFAHFTNPPTFLLDRESGFYVASSCAFYALLVAVILLPGRIMKDFKEFLSTLFLFTYLFITSPTKFLSSHRTRSIICFSLLFGLLVLILEIALELPMLYLFDTGQTLHDWYDYMLAAQNAVGIFCLVIATVYYGFLFSQIAIFLILFSSSFRQELLEHSNKQNTQKFA